MWHWFSKKSASTESSSAGAPSGLASSAGGASASSAGKMGLSGLRVLRQGPAMRVIFFYPGEEGTYVDQVNVILFENGIVHISSGQEETTTHLQNCEILWRFAVEKEDRAGSKVRLLKPEGTGLSAPAPQEAGPEESLSPAVAKTPESTDSV